MKTRSSAAAPRVSPYLYCPWQTLPPQFLPTLDFCDVAGNRQVTPCTQKFTLWTAYYSNQIRIFSTQSLTCCSSTFPLPCPKGRAGGVPNFKCLECGKRCLPTAPFLSPTGWGLFEVPTPLPLVSSLNSLSHVDLHILTNASRLGRGICSLPTLWKRKPNTNISSVLGRCGMSNRHWRAKSRPRPTPVGKVVWKERSRVSRWSLESHVAECIIASLSSSHVATQRHWARSEFRPPNRVFSLLLVPSNLPVCSTVSSSNRVSQSSGLAPLALLHRHSTPWRTSLASQLSILAMNPCLPNLHLRTL